MLVNVEREREDEEETEKVGVSVGMEERNWGSNQPLWLMVALVEFILNEAKARSLGLSAHLTRKGISR